MHSTDRAALRLALGVLRNIGRYSACSCVEDASLAWVRAVECLLYAAEVMR